MWYGTRRVDVVAPAPARGNLDAAPAYRAAATLNKDRDRIALPPAGVVLPQAPRPAALPVLATVPPLQSLPAAEAVQASHVVVNPDTSGLTAPLAKANLAGTPLKEEGQPTTVHQAAIIAPPSPTAVARDQREPPPTVADSSTTTDPRLHHIAVAQMICTLVAVVVGPLLAVLAFWVVLRRHSARHGPLFRVEFSSAPLYNVAAPSVGTSSSSSVGAGAGPATPAAESPRQGEAFDLGPTYSEAIQQQNEAPRLQDEGILRYLVDQNVKLMEQIGELETARA